MESGFGYTKQNFANCGWYRFIGIILAESKDEFEYYYYFGTNHQKKQSRLLWDWVNGTFTIGGSKTRKRFRD